MAERIVAGNAGRAALITGAASPTGIGAAVARRLARRGYALLLMDIDSGVRSTAADLGDELGLPSGAVQPWVGDVTEDGQVRRAVADAVDRFGGLHVAMANAGGGGAEVDLADLDAIEFDRIVALNLRGTFLTCQAAGLVMREAGRGSIVTVSSIFGHEPAARTGPYAAAKAGIIAMTHVLAKELAPYHVRVNCVAPGYIGTDAYIRTAKRRGEQAGQSLDDELRRVDQMVPLARHGTADDVAAAVEFLVSDDASYITGHTLDVTGGIVMR